MQILRRDRAAGEVIQELRSHASHREFLSSSGLRLRLCTADAPAERKRESEGEQRDRRATDGH